MTAPDGRTAIDLYRQRQADIGLILLDLSMPGLNGEETFRELRQINARAPCCCHPVTVRMRWQRVSAVKAMWASFRNRMMPSSWCGK